MRRALVGLALALVACQQKPTRVTETHERPVDVIQFKTRKPITLTEDTVVLDARSPFAYGLTHVRGAVNFGWERLSERAATGEFLRDLRRAGERLALAGITPATPVVVVGEGRKGKGEEGRLAWALLSLGVRDVQVAANEALRAHWAQGGVEAPKNQTPWVPSRQTDLELDDAGFKGLAKSLEDLRARRIWLVDVRTPAEYLKKDSVADALNVPWTEFYTDEGRPRPAVVQTLAKLDVKASDQVVLLSPRGVRAGAAAYALTALGFAHVRIYRK